MHPSIDGDTLLYYSLRLRASMAVFDRSKDYFGTGNGGTNGAAMDLGFIFHSFLLLLIHCVRFSWDEERLEWSDELRVI
jgi:hypothetical protein